MIIRPAEIADVPRMVELGRLFFDETILKDYVSFDDFSMKMTLQELIISRYSTAFVMTEKGEILGGIGGFLTPMYFNYEAKAAQQVFWFVHPDHRSPKSLLLLDVWKSWAKEQGAAAIWSGAKRNKKHDAMERILNRKGYAPLETVFIGGV